MGDCSISNSRRRAVPSVIPIDGDKRGPSRRPQNETRRHSAVDARYRRTPCRPRSCRHSPPLSRRSQRVSRSSLRPRGSISSPRASSTRLWRRPCPRAELENRRNQLRATLPIRRVVGPADVAALAVHIMCNTALTGATYDIDGGQQFVGGQSGRSSACLDSRRCKPTTCSTTGRLGLL